MIDAKLIQIRDAATRISAMTFKWKPSAYRTSHEERIVWQAGFGPGPEQVDYVMLAKLADMEAYYDPYRWPGGARTMKLAHLMLLGGLSDTACRSLGLHPGIAKGYAFDRIESGQVLDVGYALGLNDLKEFE